MGSINRLTRTPSAWHSAISGRSRSASCGNVQPWSLVNWSSLSGTKVACCGRTARMKSIRFCDGLPSMLYSRPGHCLSSAAKSVTSAARIWRSSGRGWTVMPWAPACRHNWAARSTLGIPKWRVLRTSATLLTFTDRAVRGWAEAEAEAEAVEIVINFAVPSSAGGCAAGGCRNGIAAARAVAA